MRNYGLAMRVAQVAFAKQGLAFKKKGLSRNLTRKYSIYRSSRSIRSFFGDGVLYNDRNSLQYGGAFGGQVVYGVRRRGCVIYDATFLRNATRGFHCIVFSARYHRGGNGVFVEILSREDLLCSLYDRLII